MLGGATLAPPRRVQAECGGSRRPPGPPAAAQPIRPPALPAAADRTSMSPKLRVAPTNSSGVSCSPQSACAAPAASASATASSRAASSRGGSSGSFALFSCGRGWLARRGPRRWLVTQRQRAHQLASGAGLPAWPLGPAPGTEGRQQGRGRRRLWPPILTHSHSPVPARHPARSPPGRRGLTAVPPPPAAPAPPARRQR